MLRTKDLLNHTYVAPGGHGACGGLGTHEGLGAHGELGARVGIGAPGGLGGRVSYVPLEQFFTSGEGNSQTAHHLILASYQFFDSLHVITLWLSSTTAGSCSCVMMDEIDRRISPEVVVSVSLRSLPDLW